MCDFAAIFGRDVLLFSDKRVVYREDIDESIAWQRWHKTAVVSSVRQLKGAERWMVNYPDRIFTDKKCNHLLEIPFPSSPIFHKVVVTHGLEETLAYSGAM